MIIEAIFCTVVGSAISGVIGNRADSIAVDTMSRIIDNFDKNKRLINHDLQKAVLRSYYLALKSICEECLESEKSNKRVATWLECEIEEIQGIMKKIEKNKYSFLPIEEIDKMKLLITTEGSVSEEINIEKDKLISYALDRDGQPKCYTELVKNTLYQRVCGFFAFEIKHNQAISNILQSQLLSNIDIKVTQLSDYLITNIINHLPQFQDSLFRIEQAMNESNKTFEELKSLFINIGTSNTDRLNEIITILSGHSTSKTDINHDEKFIKAKAFKISWLVIVLLSSVYKGDMDIVNFERLKRYLNEFEIKLTKPIEQYLYDCINDGGVSLNILMESIIGQWMAIQPKSVIYLEAGASILLATNRNDRKGINDIVKQLDIPNEFKNIYENDLLEYCNRLDSYFENLLVE